MNDENKVVRNTNQCDIFLLFHIANENTVNERKKQQNQRKKKEKMKKINDQIPSNQFCLLC